MGSGSGGLLAFPIWWDVRLLSLPMESKPASDLININYHFVRGVVELKDETLVFPDIGAILFESAQRARKLGRVDHDTDRIAG
jgi:hypothetical protein